MINAKNKITLQTIIRRYIDIHYQGFKEYELLQYLELRDPLIRSIEGQSELALFKKHFLIMNMLYTLQDIYFSERVGYLHISAVKIYLENTSSPQRTLPITDISDSKLKVYYLDWNNLYEMTQNSVEDLLDQFWKKYFALDKRENALEVLGLTKEATSHEIKARFRLLATEHHPDKGGNSESFIQIRTAYETLKQ
ncbi:MAG: DNA-J related domain-containing protein [Neptuniibacter sp.]